MYCALGTATAATWLAGCMAMACEGCNNSMQLSPSSSTVRWAGALCRMSADLRGDWQHSKLLAALFSLVTAAC